MPGSFAAIWPTILEQIMKLKNRILVVLLGLIGIATGGLLVFSIPYLLAYRALELSGLIVAALIFAFSVLSHGVVLSIPGFTDQDTYGTSVRRYVPGDSRRY